MRGSANRQIITLLAGAALAVSACGSDSNSTAASETPIADVGSVTLVAYESFPTEQTPLNDALDEFTASTGIEVDIVIAGDTGTMLAKAELAAGNPEGDVMWGIDNSFLSRAVDAGVFTPYTADGLDMISADLTALVPDGIVTPVDFGDVCVNYDISWFTQRGLDPPADFADLIDPAYADLLVVENPASSSPGLAFLAATVAEYGDGWLEYWQALRDNGVTVVDGWTEAYYSAFSFAGGDQPLVVSYGSSPPFEVLFAPEPTETAPTAVVESTCFRQVEFAGVLRGTERPAEAEQLIDFLISERFQSEVPLNLFVFPANETVELQQEFVDHAVIPTSPLTLDPATIDTERAAWIDAWTNTVLG